MVPSSPALNSAGREAQKRKTEAARLREKADRLDREAGLWHRGADGEAQTRQVIDSLPDVFAIHDCRLPRSEANLDHLLISNWHLFLIDSKHWPGTHTRSRKGWLHRDGFACYKELRKVFWQRWRAGNLKRSKAANTGTERRLLLVVYCSGVCHSQ